MSFNLITLSQLSNVLNSSVNYNLKRKDKPPPAREIWKKEIQALLLRASGFFHGYTTEQIFLRNDFLMFMIL